MISFIGALVNKLSLKSDFAKNTFTLTVGSSIAQVFPMLFYPILGRIFTPSQFGFLALITSITSVLTILATGRYENSILIAETKNDAANIVGLTLIISSSFLSLSIIFLNIFSERLGIWFNEPLLKRWVLICPISAFFIIIFNCYNEWCVRNKYYINLSWNKIINSGSINANKLFLGLVNIASNGLVVGDLIGRIFSATGCIVRALKKDREYFHFSFNRLKYLAKRYKDFPKINLPAQLLNIVGFSLPIFFISAYFKSAEVGYFAVMMDAFVLPESIISSSIRDVFRQRAYEEFVRTGRCFEIYKRLLILMFLFGTIGAIILFFILPDIFSIIMGQQWRMSGEYAQILLPMMVLDFIAMSLSSVLIIVEKLRIILFWQIYYVGITILSLVMGLSIFHDIKACLICFSIGRSSAYLIHIYLTFKYSKGRSE